MIAPVSINPKNKGKYNYSIAIKSLKAALLLLYIFNSQVKLRVTSLFLYMLKEPHNLKPLPLSLQILFCCVPGKDLIEHHGLELCY